MADTLRFDEYIPAKQRAKGLLTHEDVKAKTQDDKLKTPTQDFVGITPGEQLAGPSREVFAGVAGNPEPTQNRGRTLTFEDVPRARVGTNYVDQTLSASPVRHEMYALPPEPPLMARVGRGVLDLAQGVKQIYLDVTDPGAAQNYTDAVGSEISQYEKGLGPGIDWARIGGNVAPTLALPFGAGARVLGAGVKGVGYGLRIPVVTSIGEKIAASGTADAAITGGAAGGLNFVSEGESRGQNAALGAAGGAIGTVAGQGIKAAAGKVINTVAGRYGTPEQRATLDAAKKFGVDLRVGDIKPGYAATENILESVPFSGAGGRVKRQAEQLTDMLALGEQKFMPDKIKAGAADDPNIVMADSIRTQYGKNKADVDALYENMRALSGNAKFVPVNVRTTAKQLLDAELKLPKSVQNKEVIEELTGALEMEPLDFATGHATRSRYGDNLAQLEKRKVAGTASRTQVSMMSKLQAALEKDMQAAAADGAGPGVRPRLLRAWKDADAAYKTKVAPYNDKAIQKIMNGEFDSDLLSDKFLKADRPNLARDLMGLMDKDGQQAAKYAVYKRARDAAADPNLESGISNKAFLNKIGLGSAEQEIFDAGEREYLGQIADVLRHTRRAASNNFDPKTGNRLVRVGIGAAPIASLAAFDPLTAGLGTAAGMGLGRGANAASWSDLGKSALLSGTQIPGLELLTAGERGLIKRGVGGLGSSALIDVNR